MAFSLGAWVRNHYAPFVVGQQNAPGTVPPTISPYFELADQFQTTSPVMQAPWGITWARVIGRQKGWGSGSGTVGPTYELQVAYDSGFTSQVRNLGTFVGQRDGTDQVFVLETLDPVELAVLTPSRLSSGPKSCFGQQANVLYPIPRRLLRG